MAQNMVVMGRWFSYTEAVILLGRVEAENS
jgi:hypothetical protein